MSHLNAPDASIPDGWLHPRAEPPAAFAAELERLLAGDLPFATLREIRRLLRHELFEPKEGLTSQELAVLSYRRASFMARSLRLSAGELANDPRRLYVLHEWLGLVDAVACTVLGIHYCLALGSLVTHGRGRPELNAFVAELERMDSFGLFLATELGCGNDVAAVETQAVYDPARREFRLSTPTQASCKFMSNTGLAVPKLAVVMARLISQDQDHGVFPFLVRVRGRDGAPCPGVGIAPLSENQGHALDNALTRFDRVPIPKEHLLAGSESVLHADGRFESRIPSRRQRVLAGMDRVQTGRVCFMSASAASLRAATWICVRYTSQRFSSARGKRRPPPLCYRNVQRDVFGALASAYAFTFAVRWLQRRFRERTPEVEQEILRLTATLKAVVTAEVSEVLPRLRERCGAAGMFSQNRILEYWNQLQGVITAEGDNQLMLLRASRQLFDDSDTPWPGVPDPARSDVLDPSHGVALLRYREASLKEELKAGAAGSRRRTREPFVIWNDNVNCKLALASAYGTRVLAERFEENLEACLDVGAKQALRTLFSLWALAQVERHSGWFLAHGCVTREWVVNVPRERDRLCQKLEPHAVALVNAFGFDSSWLRAPIAKDDYVAAFHSLIERSGGITHGSGTYRVAEHGLSHADADALRRGA